MIDRAMRHLGSEHPGLPPVSIMRFFGDALEITFATTPDRPPPSGVARLAPSCWSVPLATTNLGQPISDAYQSPAPALAILGTGTQTDETDLIGLNLNAPSNPIIVRGQQTCPVAVLRAIAFGLVRTRWSESVILHTDFDAGGLAEARPAQATQEGLPDTLERLEKLRAVGSRTPHILMCGPVESAATRQRIQQLVSTAPWLNAVIAEYAGAPTSWPSASWQLNADHGTITDTSGNTQGLCLWRIPGHEAEKIVAKLPTSPPNPAAIHPNARARTHLDNEPQDRPIVRLLGHVTLHGIDPQRVDRLPAVTEVATYLHLHPRATGADMADVLWPHVTNPTATRSAYLSRLRKLLGRNNPTLMADGTYTLDLDSDLAQMRRLITRAGTRESKSAIEDLERATALVRGTPLTSTTPAHYEWATHARAELITEIIAATAHLADLHMRANNPRAAYTAARSQLRLNPTSSALWDAMLRALAQFQPDALTDALDRYTHECSNHEQTVDPDTLHLGHTLISTPTRHTTTAQGQQTHHYQQHPRPAL